jgi:hypothetical protein
MTWAIRQVCQQPSDTVLLVRPDMRVQDESTALCLKAATIDQLRLGVVDLVFGCLPAQ